MKENKITKERILRKKNIHCNCCKQGYLGVPWNKDDCEYCKWRNSALIDNKWYELQESK